MKNFFNNRVIWITGSSKGIGKATAEYLGAMGAKIILNGRDEAALTKTTEELSHSGIDCFPVSGDISDPDQCKGMVKRIIAQQGKIDILINNAGIASMGLFSDTTPEAWQRVFGINTLGAIYATKAALPYLLRSSGSVIFISSLAGKVGMPGHATYSSSKMALTSIARALQIEYSTKELHTGILYVGMTENESQKKIMTPEGTYITIPKRENIKLDSREDVAYAIAKMIVKRKKRNTLTLIGKLQKMIGSVAPGIIDMILKRQHNKSFSNMYEQGS